MYIWVFAKVGKARVTYKVAAPSTDGPIEFLTALRVQSNTVEQFIIFMPSLWLCCIYMSDQIAAFFGAFWVVGRIIYALGYYLAPAKRSLGFGIAIMANACLLIGAGAGLILH